MSKFIPIFLFCFFTAVFSQYPPAVGGIEIYYSVDDYAEADIGAGEHPQFDSFMAGPDAPLTTLRFGGKWHFYGSQWSKTWKFEETSDPDDVLGMKGMTFIPNYDFYVNSDSVEDADIVGNNKAFMFLTNIYRIDTGSHAGDLYGLIHVEDNRTCDCPEDHPYCEIERPLHLPPGYCWQDADSLYSEKKSRYRIGLARCEAANAPCEDGGWEFLGIILAPQFDSLNLAAEFGTNIQGAPYMAKDGFLYIYFNEFIKPPLDTDQFYYWLSAARAPISAVLNQAANHHKAGGASSPWRKFTGFDLHGCSSGSPFADSCWSRNPMATDTGGRLPGLENLGSHTDLVYSTATQKYYMPLYHPGSGLSLYASADGVNWDRTIPILSADSGNIPRYSTIIPESSDTTSEDGSRVGDAFYVVYHQSLSGMIDGNIPSKAYRKKIKLKNRAATVDYDGDGLADLSTKVDGGYGDFRIDLSSNGRGEDIITTNNGGSIYDVAAPADYDGDGLTDLAIKHAYGVWDIDLAANGLGSYDLAYGGWGDTNYRPVPADYDGDGKADLAVVSFDGNNGGWAIDSSSNGFRTDLDIPEHADLWSPDVCYPSTCHAVPADYDGDGKTDRGLKLDWGSGVWWMDTAADGFDITWDNGNYYTSWGEYGYRPAPADYDGDGKADLAMMVWGGDWWIDASSDGFDNGYNTSGNTFATGFVADADFTPVPSDYDGDGKADLAVKSAGGIWEIDYSGDGWGNIAYYGGWGDSTAHALHKKAIEAVVLKNTGGQISFGFTLPSAAPVKIEAYGIDGKRVATLFQGNLAAGGNRVGWSRKELEAKGLKRGLYFLSLTSKDLKVSKKLVFSE